MARTPKSPSETLKETDPVNKPDHKDDKPRGPKRTEHGNGISSLDY